MRGAKAKALRRMAEKAKLPDVAYASDIQLLTVSVKDSKLVVVDPKSEPTPEEKRMQVAVGTRVLGKSKRSLLKHAKKRLGRAPVVGYVRAERRAHAAAMEGLAGMVITPVDPPPHAQNNNNTEAETE